MLESYSITKTGMASRDSFFVYYTMYNASASKVSNVNFYIKYQCLTYIVFNNCSNEFSWVCRTKKYIAVKECIYDNVSFECTSLLYQIAD